MPSALIELLKELGDPRNVIIIATEDAKKLTQELKEAASHVRGSKRDVGGRQIQVDQYTQEGKIFQVVS